MNNQRPSRYLMRKLGLLPVFQWRVASKSEKGKYHIVGWFEDGRFECSCIGFQTRKKDCRHLRIIKNHFKGLKYEGEKYKRNKNKNNR